jgi:galactokinase
MNRNDALAQRADEAFRTTFGRAPALLCFAPGRVNLIGEHTDYNEGFVLPAALPLGTVVALAPRGDALVRCVAPDVSADVETLRLDAVVARAGTGHWSNHLRGILAARAAAGQDGAALLIDCRSLAVEPVPLDPDLRIVVLHSGVKRGLVDSEYNLRRQQCEAAARHCGVASLRDIDAGAFEQGSAGLDPVLLRRARHVLGENARTLAAVQALREGNLRVLGECLRASHASLRDDFEVSVPPVDALADVLNAALAGEGGARMTGGGFGGCLVAVTRAEGVPVLEQAAAMHFARRGERLPLFLAVRPARGALLLGP